MVHVFLEKDGESKQWKQHVNERITPVQARVYIRCVRQSVTASAAPTNQHVNNAKYILMAEELLPPAFRAARIRAEYKKPAVYGEVLYPYLAQYADRWTVKLCGSEGKPYAVMEFYKDTQLAAR